MYKIRYTCSFYVITFTSITYGVCISLIFRSGDTPTPTSPFQPAQGTVLDKSKGTFNRYLELNYLE